MSVSQKQPNLKILLREILANLNTITEADFRNLIDDFDAGSHITDQSPRIDQARELVDFINTQDKIDKLVEELKKFPKAKATLEEFEASKGIKELQFTNREQELKDFCIDSHDTFYRIIHAPAGFGKTRLLREMKSRYQKMDWACLEIELPSEQKISQETLQKHIWEALSQEPPERANISVNLASWCNKQRKDVVFFLDDVHKLDLEALRWLWKDLIHGIVKRVGSDFPHTIRWFFFVRYMAGDVLIAKEDAEDFVSLEPDSLSPFSLDVVKKTVAALAYDVLQRRWDPKRVQNLASYTAYATGGHPAAMAEILLEWADTDFTELVETYFEDEKRVWGTIKKLIDEAITQASLEEELLDTFRKLSVFRRLHYDLIDHLVEQGLLSWSEDGFFLIEQLTEQHLITHDHSGFYVDSITRQALLLQLRYEHRDDFLKLCQAGIDFYSSRYNLPTEQRGRQMFMERLYQMAQLALEDEEARKALEEFSKTALEMEFKKLRERRDGILFLGELGNIWAKDEGVRYLLELGQNSDIYHKIYDDIKRYRR